MVMGGGTLMTFFRDDKTSLFDRYVICFIFPKTYLIFTVLAVVVLLEI